MSMQYAAIGASVGSVVPGVGTAIGGAAGTVADLFTSLFGSGRSAAQIASDETQSLASWWAIVTLTNTGHVNNSYQIDFSQSPYFMTQDDLRNILSPGWQAGENGTQLGNRLNVALGKLVAAMSNNQSNIYGTSSNPYPLGTVTTTANKVNQTSPTSSQTSLSTVFIILAVIGVLSFLFLKH